MVVCGKEIDTHNLYICRLVHCCVSFSILYVKSYILDIYLCPYTFLRDFQSHTKVVDARINSVSQLVICPIACFVVLFLEIFSP